MVIYVEDHTDDRTICHYQKLVSFFRNRIFPGLFKNNFWVFFIPSRITILNKKLTRKYVCFNPWFFTTFGGIFLDNAVNAVIEGW